MTFEAVLLISFVLVITGAVKNAVPGMPSWATPLVAIALGILGTFVVAESDFGDTQTVNGVPLDAVNAWSKVIIGVMLGTGGSLTAVLGKVVSNIGSNQVSSDRTIGGNNPGV